MGDCFLGGASPSGETDESRSPHPKGTVPGRDSPRAPRGRIAGKLTAETDGQAERIDEAWGTSSNRARPTVDGKQNRSSRIDEPGTAGLRANLRARATPVVPALAANYRDRRGGRASAW
jgi:hypothetical protein